MKEVPIDPDDLPDDVEMENPVAVDREELALAIAHSIMNEMEEDGQLNADMESLGISPSDDEEETDLTEATDEEKLNWYREKGWESVADQLEEQLD